MDKGDIIIQMLAELRTDLAAARREAADEAKAIHGRVTNLPMNGCSHAAAHAATAALVSQHEKAFQQAKGVVWAAGGLSGVIGGLSGWFASFLGKAGPHP